jgi:hypothetical protein
MKLDVSSLTECASRTASPKSPPFGQPSNRDVPASAPDDPTGPAKNVVQKRGQINCKRVQIGSEHPQDPRTLGGSRA